MDLSKDLALIKPEVGLTVFASVTLVVEAFLRKKKEGTSAVTPATNPVALLSIIAITITAVITIGAPSGEAFSRMYISDGYSMFFKILFFLSALLTFLLSMRYLSQENIHYGEYYSFILFSVLGMCFMASAKDLILIYLGTELMALSVYVLTGFKRYSPRSNEAALKYFLLGAFSSAILLYGISFIYLLTGTTNLTDIAARLAGQAGDPLVSIALLFLSAAFAFKIAAVPFHMWSPDVYEGAPTPVTAFMSVGPKAAGFAVIGRVFLIAFGSTVIDWQTILIMLSILTMIVGNVLAITQVNIKRMLAYSSIAHSGYALLGIIAGIPEGISSTMNYLFIYAFMNLGAFAIVIILSERENGKEPLRGEMLSDYEGLAKTEPLWAALMLIFMFSLTGIPPTAGFVGKFYIFRAVIDAGYTWLAIVAVLMSVVSAYFYLRIVMLMYMREPQRVFKVKPNLSETLAATITIAPVLIIGIAPFYLIEFARSAMSL